MDAAGLVLAFIVEIIDCQEDAAVWIVGIAETVGTDGRAYARSAADRQVDGRAVIHKVRGFE